MKRLALMTLLLLTGCGQSPAAPTAPTSPTFALNQTPTAIALPLPASEPNKAVLRAAGPQSGEWTFTYALGTGNVRKETFQITFLADGHVALAEMPAPDARATNHWDAKGAEFEGRPRADLLNRQAFGRDRLKLTVDAADAMHGTISLRANLRWIALPVTARLKATPQKRAGLAVQSGTIVDTTAPESFD